MLLRPFPRYLAPAAALEHSPDRLAVDTLLVQRATGLRIGELVSLELNCVHEIARHGAWLKVPLGKLDSERMAPLVEETVALVDRLVAHRSPGRPLPHPRTGRPRRTGGPTEFLLTHHSRRLSVEALRDTLGRAAAAAGIDHLTPRQLRHVRHGAGQRPSEPAVADGLLGHVSAEMSVRYGRLFDATVRTEYERALTLAKDRLGPLLAPARPLPLESDWRAAPAIKVRHAGGFCVRAQAPARTRTSASTARPSAPTRLTCASSRPSASRPNASPQDAGSAAGSAKRAAPSPDRAARRAHRAGPGRMSEDLAQRIERACAQLVRARADHLRGRRRARRHRPCHALSQPDPACPGQPTPLTWPRGIHPQRASDRGGGIADVGRGDRDNARRRWEPKRRSSRPRSAG